MEPRRAGEASRRPGRALVLLLSGLWFAAALTNVQGCTVEEPPPSDPELRAALGIDDAVAIHRIDLGDEEDGTASVPATLVVRPGDLVQFVSGDHRPHLVRFPEDRIASHLLAFLTETAQDRPPPLVDMGARLVLSFEGAPAGVYPFRVEGNGAPIEGEIRVEAP